MTILAHHTTLIKENQARFNHLNQNITTELNISLNDHPGVTQVTGHPISTLTLHLMTDIVPYGWNEAVALNTNHRTVDQLSLTNEILNNNNRKDFINTLDEEQLNVNARNNRNKQRNQQGNLQLLVYELTTNTDNNNTGTTFETFARIPFKNKDVPIRCSKIVYKGAIAKSLSYNSINALGIAMGLHIRGVKIPYRNGIVNLSVLTSITDNPDYNGSDVDTLNRICDLMCLPWRYAINAKTASCVRHLHAYFRHITNVSFSATEGGHR